MVVATHDERITQLADKVIELQPHLPDAQREPHDVTLEPVRSSSGRATASDVVYIVQSGEVEVYRERDDGSEERLTVVTPGSYFGELGTDAQHAP